MIRSLAKIGFVLGLLAICAVGHSRGSGSGAVQGELFTADADGGRSVFPAEKVSLDGRIHIEAQSDHQSKVGFSAVNHLGFLKSPLLSRLNCFTVSTVSTRNTRGFDPILRFQRLTVPHVWRAPCLTTSVGRSNAEDRISYETDSVQRERAVHQAGY